MLPGAAVCGAGVVEVCGAGVGFSVCPGAAVGAGVGFSVGAFDATTLFCATAAVVAACFATVGIVMGFDAAEVAMRLAVLSSRATTLKSALRVGPPCCPRMRRALRLLGHGVPPVSVTAKSLSEFALTPSCLAVAFLSSSKFFLSALIQAQLPLTVALAATGSLP